MRVKDGASRKGLSNYRASRPARSSQVPERLSLPGPLARCIKKMSHHKTESLIMYGIALAFLAIGLRIEKKRRHIHASELPETLSAGRPGRRYDVLYGADVLLFGAFVAVVVHLASILIPTAQILLQDGKGVPRPEALWKLVGCLYVPLVLIGAYYPYSDVCKMRDLFFIRHYATASNKNGTLASLSKARMYHYLAAEGDLDPATISDTIGALCTDCKDTDQAKAHLDQLLEAEKKEKSSVAKIASGPAMRLIIGMTYGVVIAVWCLGAWAIANWFEKI